MGLQNKRHADIIENIIIVALNGSCHMQRVYNYDRAGSKVLPVDYAAQSDKQSQNNRTTAACTVKQFRRYGKRNADGSCLAS